MSIICACLCSLSQWLLYVSPSLYVSNIQSAVQSNKKKGKTCKSTEKYMCGESTRSMTNSKGLKGHWTSITSSPNFFQKSWDFYSIKTIGMGIDCMLSFTF